MCPKNRQTLWAQNTVNTNVFGTSEASVFETSPSKNTGIYVILSMLQEEFIICKKHKNNVIYVFLLPERANKSAKTDEKTLNIDLRKFCFFVPAPSPPNPHQPYSVAVFKGFCLTASAGLAGTMPVPAVTFLSLWKTSFG